MIPHCETNMISQFYYNEMQTFCQQYVKIFIIRRFHKYLYKGSENGLVNK